MKADAQYVTIDRALERLAERGVAMPRWRFLTLVRNGHLRPGEVILRHGPKKTLVRLEGLLAWLDAGGVSGSGPDTGNPAA